MKRLSLGLAIASTLVAALGSQPSQASDCVNYWTNPNTGQQECLGKELQIVQPPQAPQSVSPSVPTARTTSPRPAITSGTSKSAPGTFDFLNMSTPETMMEVFLKVFEEVHLDGSTTGLVEHLKDYCTSDSGSIRLYPKEGFYIRRSATGDRYGNCLVTVDVTTQEINSEKVAARCQFSPASIAYLTDELANTEFHSSDNNHQGSLYGIDIERSSTIFEKECRIAKPSQAPSPIQSSAPTARTTPPSQTSPSGNINFETNDFDFSNLTGLETAMAGILKGVLEIRTLEGSATGLVDHLKGCEPYRYSVTLALMPEMVISQDVIGDRSGNCALNISVTDPDLQDEKLVRRCQFSPASIVTLTDELAYEEARAFDSSDWDAINTIDSERNDSIFAKECQQLS